MEHLKIEVMKKWVIQLYAVAQWRDVESPTVKGLIFDYEVIFGEFVITDTIKNAFPIEDYITREYKQ